MIRLTSLICAFLSMTAPLRAGQPISESMVQCGALYTVTAGWVQDQNKRDRLMDAAAVWAGSAEIRAAAEGVSDPAGYVGALWPVKCSAWSEKHSVWVFTQEFRDWMRYCRALAQHEEVPLPRF